MPVLQECQKDAPDANDMSLHYRRMPESDAHVDAVPILWFLRRISC